MSSLGQGPQRGWAHARPNELCRGPGTGLSLVKMVLTIEAPQVEGSSSAWTGESLTWRLDSRAFQLPRPSTSTQGAAVPSRAMASPPEHQECLGLNYAKLDCFRNIWKNCSQI